MIRKALWLLAGLLAAAAVAHAAADAAQRRAAQVRGRRRAAQLRLPRELVVRVHPPGAAALQHAAQVRHGEVSGDQRRSRRIVDRRERRAHLHVQAAQRREVPRRHELQLRGREGDLRPHPQAAAGRAVAARSGVCRHRVDRNARSEDGRVQALEAQRVHARELREPVGLHLQRGAAEERPEVSRAQHHGHRAFHVRRARRRARTGAAASSRITSRKASPTSTAFSLSSSPARRW